MLFIVGSEDLQVPPAMVKNGHDAFAKDGHPVTFRTVDGKEEVRRVKSEV